MTANDDSEATFEEADLISLGEKLASLELTDSERAALGALIATDEVAGFGRLGRFDLIDGIRKGFNLRAGREFRTDQTQTLFIQGDADRPFEF